MKKNMQNVYFCEFYLSPIRFYSQICVSSHRALKNAAKLIQFFYLNNKIIKFMRVFILMHKQHSHIVAVYRMKSLALNSANHLNRLFGVHSYVVIEQSLI